MGRSRESMGRVENPSEPMSNECKAGNYDACQGQISSPSGTMNCESIPYENTPSSVDDTLISRDTSWKISHSMF
jgi:hypothetical protein